MIWRYALVGGRDDREAFVQRAFDHRLGPLAAAAEHVLDVVDRLAADPGDDVDAAQAGVQLVHSE